jgi:predicted PurR-regulated permease PerM
MREEFKKYFFWGIIALLAVLSYMILSPYLVTLVSTFILAYLVRPAYNWLEKRTGKNLSASICLVLVFVIILVPVGFVVFGLAQQAYSYLSGDSITYFLQKASSMPILSKLNLDFSVIVDRGMDASLSMLSSIINYVPSLLVSLLIIFFGMYYILIDWEKIVEKLKEFLPFNDKDKIIGELSHLTDVLVRGTILIAVVEFIIAFVGFYLVGTKYFLILAALIFLLAFIPSIGPLVVWVPAGIYYFVIGRYASMIGVIITGLLLSLWADTIFRSKMLGKRTGINPFVMLIGILGGIAAFGVFGFIIGPLILVYAMKLLEQVLTRS